MIAFIFLAVLASLSAENCQYPSYQYTCPANPWQECNPYELDAQIDENFCKMIVFIEGNLNPYIREVPGTLCYPDTLGGQVCMEFSPDIARVWTTGKTHVVRSVYVQYIHQGVAVLPLVMRRHR